MTEQCVTIRGRKYWTKDEGTILELSSQYITSIAEIKGLESLIRLKFLDLSENQITEIQGLETLVRLERLFLSNNQITTIQGLETLVRLEWLNLGRNQITTIQGLETLIQLEWLNLGRNQITTIQGLETLVRLEGLYLHRNQITTIQGLETLVRLEGLYLSNNQITTIQGLDTLIQLQSIRIDDNLLPSFFSNYGTTDYLHFSRYLQKWRPAQFLDQLQQNHFDERAKYNYKLLALIPYLEEQAHAIKTDAAREFCEWSITIHTIELSNEWGLLL